MQTIWNWIKENGGPLAASATLLVAITILFQFGVLNPIHQRFDDQERYINQRFDAQDQRIDDLETSVNQRFDDQDKRIHQRFDDQDKRIHQRFDAVDQRFDAQDKYMDQRFDAQDRHFNQRFDAVERRLERLENDVSELRKLDERISRNEGQIDVIRQQLQIVDTPSPPE